MTPKYNLDDRLFWGETECFVIVKAIHIYPIEVRYDVYDIEDGEHYRLTNSFDDSVSEEYLWETVSEWIAYIELRDLTLLENNPDLYMNETKQSILQRTADLKKKYNV